MHASPCPACTVAAPALQAAHAALHVDDMDTALRSGLLDWCGEAACPACAGLEALGIAHLQDVRTTRLRALAARERHRMRNERLARKERERAERRATPAATPLPGAAAAALARAKARAQARTSGRSA